MNSPLPPRCNRCLAVGHLGTECPNETTAPVFTPGKPRAPTKRHANMVPPSYTGPRRHASDDPLRFSGLPGPSRLHEGMNASELIAWRRNRTRKENAR